MSSYVPFTILFRSVPPSFEVSPYVCTSVCSHGVSLVFLHLSVVRSYGVSLDLPLCYYFISKLKFVQCKAIVVAPFLSTPVHHLHDISIVFL